MAQLGVSGKKVFHEVAVKLWLGSRSHLKAHLEGKYTSQLACVVVGRSRALIARAWAFPQHYLMT